MPGLDLLKKCMRGYNDLDSMEIISGHPPTSPFSQILRKLSESSHKRHSYKEAEPLKEKYFWLLMLVYSSSPVFRVQDWTGNYMQICWELGGSFTTFNPIEEDQ